MNKARRKELSSVIKDLRNIKSKEDLYSCISILENLKDEETDYYDNMPENLQYSLRADQAQEAIDNMEEALDILNDIYDDESEDEYNEQLDDAISKIEEARF